MAMTKQTFRNIDEYFSQYPKDIQKKLQELRQTILKAAPGATESISYQMPAYNLNGPLVYFGAWKNHIGLYPTPSGMEEFSKELAPYATGKGSAQFPIDQPLPLGLITKIVKFRLKENMEKQKLKPKKRSV